MILGKLKAWCEHKFQVETGEGWWQIDKFRFKCCLVYLEPMKNHRKGYLLWIENSGRIAPTYGGTFVSRSSNILWTWSHSFYLCPGKKQMDVTKAHQPACLDRNVLNGSSLANSHLNSQEKTVFQPQWHHGMIWNNISLFLILVTHWLILKYASLIRN